MASISSAMKRPPAQAKRQPKQQGSIREAIHLLVSLLRECNIPRVASECIRLAKYNQEGVTFDLWKLLFHVMQTITFFESEGHTQSVDTIAYYAINPTNLPTVQTIVKQYMFDKCYRREEFFALSDHIRPREMLLAFSWLLHKTDFFSKMTKHFMTVARWLEVPIKPATQNLVERVHQENRTIASELDNIVTALREGAADPSGPLCADTLHKLVWLKGELEYKSKLVQKLCGAYQTLADRIHKSTLITPPTSRRTRGHLSPHEVFLLRFPNQMKAYLAKLEKCVTALQKLVEWQECEPLFWQWMESVLDMVDKEEEEIISEGDGDEPSVQARLSEEELHAMVNSLHGEFTALLKKNKPHVDRLEHVWEYSSRNASERDISIKLSYLREQLKYEYPSVVTGWQLSDPAASAVEQFDAIDCPVYIPPMKNSARHSRTLYPAPPTPAQEAESALAQTLHDQLDSSSHRLAELDSVIVAKKLEIETCLDSMEAKLPPSLCKIELGQLVHHKKQESDVS